MKNSNCNCASTFIAIGIGLYVIVKHSPSIKKIIIHQLFGEKDLAAKQNVHY
jgi:hypothetical protein